MPITLTEVAQDSLLNCERGPKIIAQRIKKPYHTLLREVNPGDDGAKLGAETLLDIMKESGDVSPLRFQALQLGYRLSPLAGSEPDKSTLTEELADDLQALARYQKALLNDEPAEILAELLQLAIMELEENLVLCQRKAVKNAG